MDAITLRNTIFIIGAIIMAIEQGLRSAPEFRSRLPRFIASERWNFAPLILMIIAGAIWVVRSWEAPKQIELVSAEHSQQSAVPVSPPPPAAPNSGTHIIGTTFSLQLAQMLGRLPKPCNIKLTDQSGGDLPSVISWVVSYGNPEGTAICSLTGNNSEPPNADEPTTVMPTSNPGMVVHWDAKFVETQPVVHFFDSCGVKVSVSHRLPPNTPANLIWIDIGPGSPWK